MPIAARICTALAAASVLVAFAAAAPATRPAITQPAAAASTQPAVATLESRWSSVLERLGSDSFKERQDAQKEVDKATWRDLPALKALAAKVTDVEVKERLMNRVEALEVEAAVNPPPIDFDVESGSIRDVADALQKATGVPWLTWNQGGPPQLFTLHAKDKPLWEVFMALNAQHGITLQQSNEIQLILNSQTIRHGQVQGPLLFYPLTLSRVLDLQASGHLPDGDIPPDANSAAPHLEFTFGVLGDPRLKIAKAWMPEITEAVDDKGNVLSRTPPQYNTWMGAPVVLQQQTSESWPLPENLGKKITVKGTMKLTLVVAETTVEIPDMVKQGKTPIVVGNEQVVWDKFEPKDNVINFSMSVQKKGGGPMNGDLLPVHITLTDDVGNQIISQSIQGGWGGGLGMNNAGNGPIKGSFSIPTRTQDRIFDFQFKDIPIP
ncbi:MAG TPA: hypothetical protein VHQ47_10735 [Phycisphaerae bacterium]|nr:hypothetical protein [Phycisphaerae bacterium]